MINASSFRKLNLYNKTEFIIKYDRGIYFCTMCSKQIELSDAYSNKGDRLICDCCAIKIPQLLRITKGDFLRNYIWSD